MSELAQTLEGLRRHEGVEHVLLLGRDGLLVQHLGDEDLDVETVTAMVPGVASTCSTLGNAWGHGELSTVVMEFLSGVAIAVALSSDLLLLVLLRDETGFAPLLREIRRTRGELAALI